MSKTNKGWAPGEAATKALYKLAFYQGNAHKATRYNFKPDQKRVEEGRKSIDALRDETIGRLVFKDAGKLRPWSIAILYDNLSGYPHKELKVWEATPDGNIKELPPGKENRRHLKMMKQQQP